MTLVKHELKQSRKTFIIWTVAIGFFIAVCVFLFPEMKGEMDAISDMFASMGAFSSAFGMDRLNFGTLIGFYAVECGNILGIGGAFFATMLGIAALSKEERDGTAEFLLTHPISRVRVFAEKAVAVLIQIVVMNLIVYVLAAGSIALIGEEIPWTEVTLMHLSYFFLQIELAGISFGISAFLRRGSLGVGLGLATVMYFLNLVSNISESAEFLKYITPFGYTDGADIVAEGTLDWFMVLLGLAYAVVFVVIGFRKYCKKDMH